MIDPSHPAGQPRPPGLRLFLPDRRIHSLQPNPTKQHKPEPEPRIIKVADPAIAGKKAIGDLKTVRKGQRIDISESDGPLFSPFDPKVNGSAGAAECGVPAAAAAANTPLPPAGSY